MMSCYRNSDVVRPIFQTNLINGLSGRENFIAINTL